LEIISAFAVSLFLLAVIIICVGLGMKLLGEILYVEAPIYIDEETESYIHGPNRWD